MSCQLPPPPPCPFSPEGGCSYLAAGSMDGSLSILDARTGMLLAAARYAHSRGTPTQLVVVGPACLPACLPARPPARPPASPPHRLTATHQAPMIPYCPPPPPRPHTKYLLRAAWAGSSPPGSGPGSGSGSEGPQLLATCAHDQAVALHRVVPDGTGAASIQLVKIVCVWCGGVGGRGADRECALMRDLKPGTP